ncbi:RNA-editing complex protein [Trypanosoma theileri]|uniref:RNA-editing complex protein n=1 Tax=Trypanosoma theileri TaxID=67003 RepID=A0A1X0NQ40_9TRYP|nr:RNA-editing complex protein [Trypanosoma theileri]ORC86628.1 RNA-editing complex protein [Trypanosoma theileri]
MFFPTLKCLLIRPLNRVTLVGALHDVHTGFLGQTSVFQFTLTCTFLDLKTSDSITTSNSTTTTKSSQLLSTLGTGTSTGGEQIVKEQYTVRCLGDEAYTDALKNVLDDGSIVQVIGRLKTSEVMDGSKRQMFPCVLVEQGRWSSVSLLYSIRKQRRDWQLQKALEEASAAEKS